jgi:hypothetical protein
MALLVTAASVTLQGGATSEIGTLFIHGEGPHLRWKSLKDTEPSISVDLKSVLSKFLATMVCSVLVSVPPVTLWCRNCEERKQGEAVPDG